MDSSLKDSFLNLVRLGIGHQELNPSSDFDWSTIKPLAMRQGLDAVVIDGIEKLPEVQRPSKETLLEWIGEVLQGYEYRYEAYRHAVADLASFYHRHEVKMMVLKGYACAQNWPKPEHRPCGDIDIWLFGAYNKADALIKEKGIYVDISHHHHTVFNWEEFTVENHYDFVNIYDYQSSRKLDAIFKRMGTNDSYSIPLFGEQVYLPSPDLHALFLLRHLVSHFSSTKISFRQVLDWAFHVEKYANEINWEWLTEVLKEYHMIEFFNIINAICVEDLGFESSIFPYTQFLPCLKERVLQDILEPAFTTAEPKVFLTRMFYKYKRWQGNAWKQEMCYGESRWVAFWRGVWYHLLKPASI